MIPRCGICAKATCLAAFLASAAFAASVDSTKGELQDLKGRIEALRRDMALSRLTKTRDSIADVAADLGYADTSAFYRAFVEWTGMAPLHYRRKWLGEAA